MDILLNLQDFAFAFQCFMLEYWDREDTGRWPKNPSLSPNVSDDPVLMQDLLTELGKMEPNQEANPWVCISILEVGFVPQASSREQDSFLHKRPGS